MKNIVILCSALFSSVAFAEKASLMGCEWNIPDRLYQRSESLWASKSNEDDVFSYINFKDDFFNKEYIEITFEQTDLQRMACVSVIDNGYELVVCRDYLKSNQNISFPAVVVIKNKNGKGVLYLNN